MAGLDDEASLFERRITMVASTLAPTTLFTALLFYYGYVTATSEYRYFGLELNVLPLSTTDYLIRSVAAVYVPLGLALLAGLLAIVIHVAVNRWTARGTRPRPTRLVTVLAVLAGAGLAVRGSIGVAVPSVSATEPIALTPLTFGAGVTLVAYGADLHRRAARGERQRTTLERVGLLFTAGLVVLSVFWSANSFASAYGEQHARRVAAHLLDESAGVLLDTVERLTVDYCGVTEYHLAGPEEPTGRSDPTPPDQADAQAQKDEKDGTGFAYRYTGLRLLVASEETLFLVPEQWHPKAWPPPTTLAITVGPETRVQYFTGPGPASRTESVDPASGRCVPAHTTGPAAASPESRPAAAG